MNHNRIQLLIQLLIRLKNRTIATIVALLSISACHPPITNKLYQSNQHTQSWLGVPVAELLVVKGNPSRIQYLGWNRRAAISSEFWTPELDRYIPLYRQYGPATHSSKNKQANKQFYQTVNSDGPWLITYRYPVRNYRSEIRECVEYFIIDKAGAIKEAGYKGHTVNDFRHCPTPEAHPSLRARSSVYSFHLKKQ